MLVSCPNGLVAFVGDVATSFSPPDPYILRWPATSSCHPVLTLTRKEPVTATATTNTWACVTQGLHSHKSSWSFSLLVSRSPSWRRSHAPRLTTISILPLTFLVSWSTLTNLFPHSEESGQPLGSAMTTLLEVFIAAIKSFEKGKALFRAMLAYWISPSILKGTASDSITASTLDALKPQRTPNDFLKEAEEQLLQPVQGDALKEFSRKLKAQFKEGLLTNPACMLPSYNHQLPNRSEHGQYLALDVGGSTLRIALVELRGRTSDGSGDGSRILRLESFKIEREMKNLEGMAFFDWMAQKIVSTVSKAVGSDNTAEKPLLMGMAWSFPIE